MPRICPRSRPRGAATEPDPASRGRPQTFNEIFKGYEERTSTKLNVTCRSLDALRAKVAEDSRDFDAYTHIN